MIQLQVACVVRAQGDLEASSFKCQVRIGIGESRLIHGNVVGKLEVAHWFHETNDVELRMSDAPKC